MATYTITLDDAYVPAITFAREQYNAGLAGGADDPAYAADNQAYVVIFAMQSIAAFVRRKAEADAADLAQTLLATGMPLAEAQRRLTQD